MQRGNALKPIQFQSDPLKIIVCKLVQKIENWSKFVLHIKILLYVGNLNTEIALCKADYR
jgi:hypothetical protein